MSAYDPKQTFSLDPAAMRPSCKSSLNRPIAIDGDAEARADVRKIVPDRDMLDAPVVPESHGMRLPAEAHLEIRHRTVLMEHFENRIAFEPGQFVDPSCEYWIDVQAFPDCFGMGPHNRMLDRGNKIDLVSIHHHIVDVAA